MIELVTAWFGLWALISATWLVARVSRNGLPKRKAKEPKPKVTKPLKNEDLVRFAEKEYLRELSTINGLKLEEDEKDAAKEYAKRKFTHRIKEILG